MLETFIANITGTASLIGSLAVINFIIIFHELGHYYAAIYTGITAESVCVGFGRLIFEREDSNGTRWQCRLWPFGGYVDLIGTSSQKLRQYTALNYRSKVLILLGGILANCLLAWLLFSICHVLGYEYRIPKVSQVASGSTVELAGMQADDTICMINNNNVPGWQDVMYAIINASAYHTSLELQVKRNDQESLVLLQPFTTSHIFDHEHSSAKTNLLERLGITPAADHWPAVIEAVEPNSPAAQGKLQPGDHIIAIDDNPIDQGHEALLVIANSPGKTLTFTYKRDQITQRTQIHLASKGAWQQKGFLGIRIAPPQKTPHLYRLMQSPSMITALVAGLRDCMRYLVLQCSTMYLLLIGKLSINMLAGPVIIIAQTFRLFDLNNIVFLLNWAAIVNISLAFINLLPVPIFDGGRLLFIGLEIIKGAPLATNTVNLIDRFTFAALLGLAAVVTFNDIFRVMGIAP